jgi:FKBP-type peptidyl-prolyl cis-trans isomerase SlyD
MDIKKDCVVDMHYTLKNDAEEIIDSSENKEPLSFIFGAGNIIPGLESALDGEKVGSKLDVTVAAEDAYGERQEDMVQQAPRSAFSGVDELEVGMEFHAETEQGPLPMMITKIDGDTVTVDANHPLAGQQLHFSVSIEGVRSATAEELELGYIKPHEECEKEECCH